MRRSWICLLCLLAGIAALGTSLLAGPLRAGDQFEGKWKVTLVPEDGGKEIQDTLVFKYPKFSAETFVARGFAPVDYELDMRRGPTAGFAATASSPKEG